MANLRKMRGGPDEGTQPQQNGSKTPGKIGTLLKKAKEKATSIYNKSAGRTVSTISKSFDGREVQGKKIDVKSPGVLTPKRNISKEVYKMPGGGKHVERTSYNKEGNVLSRKVKDTNVNPSNLELKIKAVKSSVKEQRANRRQEKINRLENRVQKLKGTIPTENQQGPGIY